MGMFDEVRVPCPTCGKTAYFQSKGGDCLLVTYELHKAPDNVLSNINRHSPYICEACRTPFKVEINPVVRVVKL